MRKKGLVEGVGVNDADYLVTEYLSISGKRTLSWICPFYKTWKSMIVRAYSPNYKKDNPTYTFVSVKSDWLTFSNFKVWMETQDWEGNHLDKDILGDGKLYSSETCCFISQSLNKFLTDSCAKRGSYLIGVDFQKSKGMFRSRCSNPITNKSEFLGVFSSEIAAHEAWLSRKVEIAKELAKTIKDSKVSEFLVAKYENYYGWNKQ